MHNNPLSHLGAAVADAMHEAGMSESRAALESGISRQTLRRQLAKDCGTAAKLGALAHVLNLEPDALVGRAMESQQ